ncbi:DoxX family protein [uncultured Microscilla sp.]|uniref:DoxX family protein n=1 Tax=uncultured Microscilla sp. TaxID=432653 RepID=UPI00261926D2|nr:DoxX family protein [uncultured Microscilla sp.]
MRIQKIIYWVATGLLSAMVLMSAGMYVFNYEKIKLVFTNLSYPTYIIYPLAVAKVLAVVAILTKKSAWLKEWAYAGLFFDFLLALAAHLAIADGEHYGAIVALVLLTVSYYFDRKFL